jgi:hypothetical protein
MGGFGATYQHHRSGLLVSFTGRHESGMPLDVEEERLEELQSAPGAELVDFKRGRVFRPTPARRRMPQDRSQ